MKVSFPLAWPSEELMRFRIEEQECRHTGAQLDTSQHVSQGPPPLLMVGGGSNHRIVTPRYGGPGVSLNGRELTRTRNGVKVSVPPDVVDVVMPVCATTL